MLIFWKIRYFHKADRTFGDRTLCLDTQTLDPTKRATIEFLVESQTKESERRIVEFRPLFVEGDWNEALKRLEHGDVPKSVGLPDYLEDENGKEITDRELGPLLTGNPNAVLIPHGAKPYDIELMQAEPKPIPLDATLSDDELRPLGYFARDLKELSESAFRKEGPGRLGAVGAIPWVKSSDPKLETAVNDDEIRSYVTIFRRLYMAKEPANFLKSVEVYVKALGDHPYARWVAGNRNEYESNLTNPASFPPFVKPGQFSFTMKRLIDVFLYTQYAHQPDEKRQRQYDECLAEANRNKSFLTWLFLTAIWTSGLQFISAGRVIVAWFKKYCDVHGLSPDVLASLRDDHEGIGVLEKKVSREKRLFDGKIEQLAKDLWVQNGCPDGGHEAFLDSARQSLQQNLCKTSGKS